MGEGIYYAISSGQAVGWAIARGRIPMLTRWRYRLAFLPQQLDLLSARLLQLLFYRYEQLGYWVLTRTKFQHALARGFERGLRLDQILRRFIGIPV